ncbi:hypothetical protein I6F20_17020 [Bradyrhizobium sp. IC3123]|uniref:hypothetical protein n=1 Tax=Bradyrhizobium sp. IC3123 TaxID=2793803 RepID=UPI001CD554A4|nr:hypothetical protein [Bradyrhizobium sp. IC3123]MCA1390770.1 hypothetical protein [Bradyrhizobium sp. IC3123]
MNNRHRIDLLADLRSQLKALKEQEAVVRAEVLANPDDMIGDEHEATLTQTVVERVDLDLMKLELGMIFLRPYLREQTITRVQLKPVSRARKPRTGRTS